LYLDIFYSYDYTATELGTRYQDTHIHVGIKSRQKFPPPFSYVPTLPKKLCYIPVRNVHGPVKQKLGYVTLKQPVVLMTGRKRAKSDDKRRR